MPITLKELIKAGGGAGSAGQSFSNTGGLGASSGARISDYILPTGSPTDNWDPAGDTLTTYNSGGTYNPYVSFNYQYGGNGSRFYNIRRDISGWTNNTGSSITLNSVTWNDSAGTATLNMTIYGDYDSSTQQSLTAFQYYFSGYTAPDKPSDGGAYQVVLFPSVSGSSSPSGSSIITPSFTYDPDIASFNPNQTFNWSGIRVYKQAYPSWTTMYEWQAYLDSGYTTAAETSFYSSNDGNNAAFAYYTYGPVYIRYRIKAAYNGGTAGSWQDTTASWQDPRTAF